MSASTTNKANGIPPRESRATEIRQPFGKESGLDQHMATHPKLRRTIVGG